MLSKTIFGMFLFTMALNSHAQVYQGGSTLLQGMNGPDQLTVSGDTAVAIYNSLSVLPRREGSFGDQELVKTAHYVTCTYYISNDAYSCRFLLTNKGLTK